MSTLLHRLKLAVAIAVLSAAAPATFGRELGNFDINVDAAAGKAKQAVPVFGTSAVGRIGTNVDAIGRATFTWVQQDLPIAAKAKANSPEAAARAHLALLLGAGKSAPNAAQTLQLQNVSSQRGGAELVQFKARLNGISIFREDLALLMDANRRLIAMRGPLPTTDAAAAKALPTFERGAAEAIAAALGVHAFRSDVVKQLSPLAVRGDYQYFTLDRSVRSESGAVVVAELRAKPVYFRTRAGLQPAWYVETQVQDGAGKSRDAYAQVISARDASLLFRVNQIAHLTSYTYRVWAEGGSDRLPYPSPEGRNATPDPDGLPGNNVVPFIAQELRTLANAPFSQAATDGWLPAGAVVTSGNNIVAYADRTAPDGLSPGDYQPALTSPNTFDYVYDTQQPVIASTSQSAASTVQMFYLLNWMHDWFYDHGFTEADGNAQVSNYGRGGLAGDPMVAEADDYNVANNANMLTPGDGMSPKLQMGIYQRTNPTRSSATDATVVMHEWAHYLSGRLVVDGTGLDNVNGIGLGEGWSDFVALLATVKEGDALVPGNGAFNGAYSTAGYSNNSSYFGDRRYPMSTDMAKSPLTLRYIVSDTPLPTNPAPAFGARGDFNSEVHSQGEIWTLALWECYTGMLRDNSRLSFAEAQRRMKDYLVGGLKLTPASPTMTEARDAILATILAAGESADFNLFTAGFAKRGLGAGAIIPDRYSTTMFGTLESTAVGTDIAVRYAELGIPSGCDADSVLDQGETAQLTFQVGNTGFASVAEATATLASSNPALIFPQGNTVNIGSVPLFGSTSVRVPVRLASTVAANTPITVTITPEAPGMVNPPGTASALKLYANYNQAARSSVSESFDGNEPGWASYRLPMGESFGTWSRQSEVGAVFQQGADTAIAAVNWIQSPPMAVGSQPLVLTLNHRFALESSATRTYDGAVIQASIDGGTTWADVDYATVGYSQTPISDCCGNPLAGRRAFTGYSDGYPRFGDYVINLGTAYANQGNLRLRFGVATDFSVSTGGWDINSISVSGLTDTPFTSIQSQPASCTVSNGKALQGALSGTYSSSTRSGEGVLVDFGQVGGTPIVFFTWYTYGQGTPQWLVGSNTFAATDTSVAIDLINTSGASFGSGFRPQDVARNPWGSVALTFPSCDTMTLTYQKTGGEAGTLNLSRVLGRLEQGQCGLLQGGQSGTYYSTSRSGEGVLIDFGQVGGTPIEFFTWYTYGQGTQQWLVGSNTFAAADPSVSVDLISTSGGNFGNAFRPQDVVRSPWGRVTHRFTDCNTLELSYQKNGGESGTQVLTRALGRLGDGQCH